MNTSGATRRRGYRTGLALAVVALCALLPTLAVAQEAGQTDPGVAGEAVVEPGTSVGTGAAVETGAAAPTEAGAVEAEPPVPTSPVPTSEEVMSYLNDLWRSDSSHAEMTMAVVTENWSRTLELESWSRGKDDALIIIRSPAREAGTATLRTDEGLWNYAPRADRLMRIPSGLLSESWMGSHFTNDDLMRESDWDDDFETRIEWVERDGQRYLLATSTPLPTAAVVWTRIDYLLREDWIPVEADYYDGDELLRTMRFSDVREIDGRPIPLRMDVIPHDKPGESTTVTYDSLELNTSVNDSLFTQRGLRRAAQR